MTPELSLTIPLGVPVHYISGVLRQGGFVESLLFTPGDLAGAINALPTAEDTTWWDLLSSARIALRPGNPSACILLTPEEERVLSYRTADDEIVDIRIRVGPMVWLATFRDRALAGSWAFLAPKLPLTIGETDLPLRSFPFGNVYGADARICWGGVSTESITPKDPLHLPRLFFSTVFNADLFHASWLGDNLEAAGEDVDIVDGTFPRSENGNLLLSGQKTLATVLDAARRG